MIHTLTENNKTFSKILIAIDESRTSTSSGRAIDYAIKVARDYDAQLIILHVIRSSNTNLQSTSLPSYLIEMKKRTQSSLVKITEKIHEESDKQNILRMKTEIVASSRIADAIVNYAKDKHMDLIVVGSRGRSKLKGMLLGSVASDVVRYAHCPVLTVK
jgi:nucleotide-binding universal stress UspA family protein